MLDAVARLWQQHHPTPPPDDLAGLVLTLAAISGPDSLRATADRMDAAAAAWSRGTAEPLAFAFEPGPDPSQDEPEPGHALGRARALLASLLLDRRYAHVTVLAVLPADPVAMLQLARSGLLFALAQRTGRTHVTVERDSDVLGDALDDVLEEWRKPWRPADYAFRRRVLAQQHEERHGGTGGGPVQDRLVTFVNPHMVSRARVNIELTSNVVVPWLQQLVEEPPPINRALSEGVRLPDVSQPAWLLDELVFNLADHAFDSYSEARSYVQLFSTRASDNAPDRLHLTVWDNGLGLLPTLRSKAGSDLADEELLTELLENRLRYRRGRGKGLAEAIKVVRARGGTATVVSAGSNGQGTVLAHVAGTGVETLSADWLTTGGTLVMLTVELPCAARRDLSPALAAADDAVVAGPSGSDQTPSSLLV